MVLNGIAFRSCYVFRKYINCKQNDVGLKITRTTIFFSSFQRKFLNHLIIVKIFGFKGLF